jgi:FkbM family methyltransferase
LKTITVAGHEIQIAGNDGDFGADWHVIEKYWKPTKGQVCLDVGCGPGLWSLVSLACGATCYAIDASRLALSMLIDQALLNCYTGLFVVPTAIYNRSGPIWFSTNRLAKEEEVGQWVPCTTLDELFNDQWVDWINMDVEGVEYEVILGAKELLSRCKPNMIIEVHRGVSMEKIVELIKSTGEYDLQTLHCGAINKEGTKFTAQEDFLIAKRMQ